MTRRPASAADPLASAADTVLATSRLLLALSLRSVLNASVEVTVAQQRVLTILEAHGPMAVNQVAERLGVDQSNAGRHCQRLQRSGLVDRVRSETDRRSVEVRITDAGARLLAEITAARRLDIVDVLEQMPDHEVAVITSTLAAFNRAAAEVDPWSS